MAVQEFTESYFDGAFLVASTQSPSTWKQPELQRIDAPNSAFLPLTPITIIQLHQTF
ncbi:hypothetical protein RMSM_04338 [Rhodopirellula maiorica SM1]|uniref:Uncharacterized protein n=1 Tax=Rhodopirellula maiorica SM1 TaxID=1265738 RepID=M5RTM4_9BACT|nr:hypothetical protein RMSM_04338 [Rhodopirellula maiorica SM1]